MRYEDLPKGKLRDQVLAKLAEEGDQRAAREVERTVRGLPRGDTVPYRHVACGTLIAVADDGGALQRHAEKCEHRSGDYRAVLPADR